MFSHMLRATYLTNCRIEYNKKPGKPTVIKVVKDASIPRDDLYKSGTIHTGQGEPPNSQSRPTPRGRQVAGKPITKGKLLRPGGPGGGPSKLATRPATSRPVPQPTQQSFSQPKPATQQPLPIPVITTSQQRPIPQIPNFDTQSSNRLNRVNHSRNVSSSSVTRAPPPPPPPLAVKRDTYKALYAFAGQSENELTLQENEIIEVLSKEGNGKPLFPPHFPHSSSSTYPLTSIAQAGGLAKNSTDPPKAGPLPPI